MAIVARDPVVVARTLLTWAVGVLVCKGVSLSNGDDAGRKHGDSRERSQDRRSLEDLARESYSSSIE